MKAYSFIFLVFYSLSGIENCLSQKAFIPDTNFRNFLQTTYPNVMNGDSIIIDSAATITGRMIIYQPTDIASIEGVQYFINLDSLRCDMNKLTAIPDLGAMANLQYLNCGNNLLTSLPDLSANTALIHLSCYTNQITKLPDLSPFANLEELYCSGNLLDSLPALDSLKKLRVLHCGVNKLVNLPNFKNNTALEWLACHVNNITSLPDFSSNTALKLLSCSTNPIFTFPNLPANINLEFISCSTCQLTSLPDLSSNIKLLSINFGDNQLTILPDLSNNVKLRYLDFSYNQITKFPDLSVHDSLGWLLCDYNKLDTFPDLSGKVKLSNIGAYENEIAAIPVLTNNPSLKDANFEFNKLDFSDALALRIADTAIPSGVLYGYQKPFGKADTFIVNTGDSVVLSIGSQDSALSYQWFRNGDTIQGFTDTMLIIQSANISDSGSYTCKSYGVALLSPPMKKGPGTSEFISEPLRVVVDTATGVAYKHLIANSISVSAYPNPFAGIAVIKVISETNHDIYTLTMYDETGRMLMALHDNYSGRFEINGNELSPGVYYYVVTDNKKQKFAKGKLIINK